MPLLSWIPRPQHIDLFKAALQHLVDLGRIRAGLDIDPNPHPVFTLSLKHVVSKIPLPANPIGWRYFAGQAQNLIVACDISEKSPSTVTSLRYGEKAKKELEAALALDNLEELKSAEYHPGVLRIPGALIEGSWIRARPDGNGVIIPFGNVFNPPPFERKSYAIDNFLSTLQPVAERILARYNSLSA